jgi:hypothetical protein
MGTLGGARGTLGGGTGTIVGVTKVGAGEGRLTGVGGVVIVTGVGVGGGAVARPRMEAILANALRIDGPKARGDSVDGDFGVCNK